MDTGCQSTLKPLFFAKSIGTSQLPNQGKLWRHPMPFTTLLYLSLRFLFFRCLHSRAGLDKTEHSNQGVTTHPRLLTSHYPGWRLGYCNTPVHLFSIQRGLNYAQ